MMFQVRDTACSKSETLQVRGQRHSNVTHHSLFVTRYSLLFVTRYSSLVTRYSLFFVTRHSLFFTRYSLFVTRYSSLEKIPILARLQGDQD